MTQEFADVLFERGRSMPPNMTKDNLIVQRITNPTDIQDTHLDMAAKAAGVRATSPASRTVGFRGLPGGYKTFIPNHVLLGRSTACGHRTRLEL